jgi:hypothetical protein
VIIVYIIVSFVYLSRSKILGANIPDNIKIFFDKYHNELLFLYYVFLVYKAYDALNDK